MALVTLTPKKPENPVRAQNSRAMVDTDISPPTNTKADRTAMMFATEVSNLREMVLSLPAIEVPIA